MSATLPPRPTGRADQRGWRPFLSTLALAALAACGGGSGTPADGLGQDDAGGSPELLTGQVEKGPLQRGSMVTVDTLTTAAVSLAAGTTTLLPGTSASVLPPLVPTGASFTMEVKDNYGSFAPQSAALFQAAFVETTAQGYWYNEVTGQRSDDFITLRAVSNLKTDKALNVNVLTDLSRERTLVLARAAATAAAAAISPATNPAVSATLFNTARTQAQGEVLKAFGIKPADLGGVPNFGEMDLRKLVTEVTPRSADQILLAISALVAQIGQDGAGVTDFLSRFEADLADNGVIDDASLREAILLASAKVSFDQVAANMNSYYGSTRYAGADLVKWVDRSGGVYGLLDKDVQYLPNMQYSSGTAYGSRSVSPLATASESCLGAELNDPAFGSVQLVEASVALTAPRLLAASARTTVALKMTPSNPAAVAYLVRWDAVSGACSTTNQPNKTRLFALAAVTPDVAKYLAQFRAQFSACFSLPVASRVLAVDNTLPASAGGPTVTRMADACQALFATASRDGIDYLQNGYSAGQNFYTMLNDGALTKAVAVKDIRILRGSGAGTSPLTPYPNLALNVTYTDRYNRLSNFLVGAQKLPAGPAANAGWILTGGQQPVDISVVTHLRRYTSMANFTTATPSVKENFRTALGVFIYPNGPGGQLADGRKMSAVRVSGTGLPSLVFVPPVAPGQTWMDLSNLDGDVVGSGTKRCGGTVAASGPVSNNCPYVWVARTVMAPAGGATPPALKIPTSTEGSCTTLATPNQNCAWGGNWMPTNVTAQLTSGTPLTIEVFYGGQTTPTYSFSKSLNSSLQDLSKVDMRKWVMLDPATLVAARPTPGQTSLDLSWTGQVMNSVEVRSATVSLANAGATVSAPDEPVARGSNAITLWPTGEIQWAPPSAIPNASWLRGILLTHRTWDGSVKSQWFSYDLAN